MFDLFEPRHRRIKDEWDVRDYFARYGEDAPAVLSNHANDPALSSRDRRHWRRLARKAQRQKREWIDGLKSG